MLTPDMLLCGQRFGCLNLVSLDSNYTSYEFLLPDKNAHIHDLITYDSKNIVLATQRGLY
jgi:hypothetical protein